MEAAYQIIRINEDTWRIEDDYVRMFLLAGSKKALLIDSGANVHNAKEICAALTDLPVELINTHGDCDHIGSNEEFENPYMSPAETIVYYEECRAMGMKAGDITPVWDGDILDLGDRTVKIIDLPGHTPGSIGILDQKHRILFSGDPIQNGEVYMYGSIRDLHAYRHSLIRLEKMADEFDMICPSHAEIPIRKSIIGELILDAEKMIAGDYEYTEGESYGTKIRIAKGNAAVFLLDAEV